MTLSWVDWIRRVRRAVSSCGFFDTLASASTANADADHHPTARRSSSRIAYVALGTASSRTNGSASTISSSTSAGGSEGCRQHDLALVCIMQPQARTPSRPQTLVLSAMGSENNATGNADTERHSAVHAIVEHRMTQHVGGPAGFARRRPRSRHSRRPASRQPFGSEAGSMVPERLALRSARSMHRTRRARLLGAPCPHSTMFSSANLIEFLTTDPVRRAGGAGARKRRIIARTPKHVKNVYKNNGQQRRCRWHSGPRRDARCDARRLVLASTSRYRRDLLTRLQISSSLSQPLTSTRRRSPAAAATAQRLAEAKARAVAAQLSGHTGGSGRTRSRTATASRSASRERTSAPSRNCSPFSGRRVVFAAPALRCSMPRRTNVAARSSTSAARFDA